MTGDLIGMTGELARIGEGIFVEHSIACNFGSGAGAVLASCSWGSVLVAVAGGGSHNVVSGCFECSESGIEACSEPAVADSGLKAIPHIAFGATAGT